MNLNLLGPSTEQGARGVLRAYLDKACQPQRAKIAQGNPKGAVDAHRDLCPVPESNSVNAVRRPKVDRTVLDKGTTLVVELAIVIKNASGRAFNLNP